MEPAPLEYFIEYRRIFRRRSLDFQHFYFLNFQISITHLLCLLLAYWGIIVNTTFLTQFFEFFLTHFFEFLTQNVWILYHEVFNAKFFLKV